MKNSCLVAFLAALSSCGASEGAHSVILAEFSFDTGEQKDRDLMVHEEMNRVHWFAKGWAQPGANGVWSLGNESVVYLNLVGEQSTLTLEYTSAPQLIRAGQEVTVSFNESHLGLLPLRDGRTETIEFPLPDEALIQGLNKLTFHAKVHNNTNDEPLIEADSRPLALYLKSLRAEAILDEEQAQQWRESFQATQPPDHWRLIKSSEEHAREQAALPDVFVILLDAARPDHFGCYGYDRETTPVIDQIARDGIVFEQAFANTPYTVASIPCLFTGRLWRDHNVLSQGDALSDSFLTLPEVLREVGYRTIAYSASPNASRATGTDQGFTEFHEVWTHPEKGPGINFELPETLLARRGAEEFGPEPVFCYLHLMPPHEPYMPGPEHDLWRDESYEGTVDGSYEVVMDVLHGKRVLDEQDRERLVALYDGNLHLADASVGRILDHWRGLNRDRELLVVILSDHGEAFGEHGLYTHNNSVYDEMIRIPLIVSPAHLARELKPVEGSLLAITDVFPLLLRTLGISPPGGSELPLRFEELLADPATTRKAVVLRTVPGLYTYGYRTERYLAVFDGWSRQELYDMTEDPRAENNLRLERSDVFASLVGQLVEVLAETSNSTEADEADLTEEDLSSLEALGYF